MIEGEASAFGGIAIDEVNGMIYLSEFTKSVIWRMTIEGKDQQILAGQRGKSTVFLHQLNAWKGIREHEDGNADKAKFHKTWNLKWLDKRRLVCADYGNSAIRVISIGIHQ